MYKIILIFGTFLGIKTGEFSVLSKYLVRYFS